MSNNIIYGGHTLRIVIGLLLLFLMLEGEASAVTSILDCQGDLYSISSPGEYVISQNLIGNGGYHCINIKSDDVILDGKGHWILGDRHSLINPNNGHDYYYGIWVSGAKNVTIKNVSVRDWKYGIAYDNVQNGSIIDSAVWSNEFAGIALWDSSNNTLRNNNAYTYPIREGIYAFPAGLGFILSGNNDIDTTNKVNTRSVYYLFDKKNLLLDGKEAGHLTLSNSSNVTIKNSNIEGDGIKLVGSTGNRIYHNNIKNSSKTAFFQDGTRQTWWTGSYDSLDNNSWDNGYPDGGNYWWNYNGADNFKGPNQDMPGSDGIGDIPYNISGGAGAKDRYPIMRENGWISTCDILSYYRGLGDDPIIVETTDLLKAADDWSNNIIPPGCDSSITTQQLLALADEWSKGG
jgi:parallel beta-helix repeat protein